MESRRLTKALTIVKESSRASRVGFSWRAGSSPLEMSTTSARKKEKSNQTKIYMFKGLIIRGMIQTWLTIGAS
jgi:hypothetical protein